ncbi:hypothetical protein CBD41_02310 [bacterium TMED181]|nr:hypothetical protein [Planctomycetota bacterium]OUW46597.1 MAG: hypothetical protein CBD41_02310 [bacterium TMED181]
MRDLRPSVLLSATFIFTVIILGQEVFSSGTLWADTVHLTNGSKLDGKVVSENDREVVLKVGPQGIVRLQRKNVAKIEINQRTGTPSKKPDSRRKSLPVKPKSAPPASPVPEVSKSLRIYLDAPLAPLKGEQRALLDQWVKDLQRQRVIYRTRAEKHLGTLGSSIVPHLHSVARGSFVRARICALRLLVRFPRYESMPVALAGLEASDPWIRKWASELAGKISGKVQNYPWKENSAVSSRARLKKNWDQWYAGQEKLREILEAKRAEEVPSPSRPDLKDLENPSLS